MAETNEKSSDEESPAEEKSTYEDSNRKTNQEEASQDKTPDAAPLPSCGKILWLARPELPQLFVALILMITAEATDLIKPLIVARAYNTLVDPSFPDSERMPEISRTMVIVLAVHFVGGLCQFVRGSIMGATGQRVVARLRNDLYRAILKQDISFFDEHKTGELVSRLGSDTTLIRLATSLAFPQTIFGIVKIGVAVCLMFYISPKLAGVCFGLMVALFSVALPFGKLMGALSKAHQDILGQAQIRSTEALGAMRTVQSFTAEAREAHRYLEKIGDPARYKFWYPTDHQENKTTYSVGFFMSITTTGFFVFIYGVWFAVMYLCLWLGFKLVVDGEMSLGDLTAFQAYIIQIGFGLGETNRNVTQVIEARGASGRIFQLMERVPSIPTPPPPKDGPDQDNNAFLPPLKPSCMNGDIEFRNVSFSYESRPDLPVLRDFSLTVPANSTAALVGASGAGKSTVVSLLQRFYDVSSGSICIDGNDIRSLDLKWMRSNIGYVQQEPQLFGVTVRENVCYGVDREVGDEEIEKACREANAHDFIANWPNGYDTMVGERGVKLSGGQKQRVAIARALLINPRLLLLDEATSALDAESEHLVQEAVEKAVIGRTVVIVAHRLSTIKQASQIVVLGDQQIVDVGTHDALLGRCGKYQELINRQSVVRPGQGIFMSALKEFDSEGG